MSDLLKSTLGLTLALSSPELRSSDSPRNDRACTEASSRETSRPHAGRRFSLSPNLGPAIDLRSFQPSSVRMFLPASPAPTNRNPVIDILERAAEDQRISDAWNRSSGPERETLRASYLQVRARQLIAGRDVDGALELVRRERNEHPEAPGLAELEMAVRRPIDLVRSRYLVQVLHAALLQNMDEETARLATDMPEESPNLRILDDFRESIESGRASVEQALAALPQGTLQALDRMGMRPALADLARSSTVRSIETVVKDLAWNQIHADRLLSAHLLISGLREGITVDQDHIDDLIRRLPVMRRLQDNERARDLTNIHNVGRICRSITDMQLAASLGYAASLAAGPVLGAVLAEPELLGLATGALHSTVTSAALPVLTHGTNLTSDQFLQEFGHNLQFSIFLGLGNSLASPLALGESMIASRAFSIGGMAAFDYLSDPINQELGLDEILANAAFNDTVGRIGFLNPSTIARRAPQAVQAVRRFQGSVNRALDGAARRVLPLGGPLLSLAVGVPVPQESTRIARRSPQRVAGEPPPLPASPRNASSFMAPFVSMEVETLRGPTDGRPSDGHIPLNLQVRNSGDGRPRRGFDHADRRTLRIRVGNEAHRTRILDLAREQAVAQGFEFMPMESLVTNQGVEPQFAVRGNGQILYLGRVSVGAVRTGTNPASVPGVILPPPGETVSVAMARLPLPDVLEAGHRHHVQVRLLELVMPDASTRLEIHNYALPQELAAIAGVLETTHPEVAQAIQGDLRILFGTSNESPAFDTAARRMAHILRVRHGEPAFSDRDVSFMNPSLRARFGDSLSALLAAGELGNGISADLPPAIERVTSPTERFSQIRRQLTQLAFEGRAGGAFTVSSDLLEEAGLIAARLEMDGPENLSRGIHQDVMMLREGDLNSLAAQNALRRLGRVLKSHFDAHESTPIVWGMSEEAFGRLENQVAEIYGAAASAEPPAGRSGVVENDGFDFGDLNDELGLEPARAGQTATAGDYRQAAELGVPPALREITQVSPMRIEPSALPETVRRNRRDFLRSQMVRIREVVNDEGYGRVRGPNEDLLWLNFQALAVDDVEAGEHATPGRDPVPQRLEAARSLAEHFGIARNETFLRRLSAIIEESVRRAQRGFDSL